MSIYKRVMFIGFGIETFGIVFALICVFAQIQVPTFVPTLIFIGLITVLISSFLLRKRIESENDGKNKVFDKKLLIPFVILIILIILTVLLSTIDIVGL